MSDDGTFPCAACGSTRRDHRWHPLLLCWVRTVRLMRRNGGFFAYEERWLDALPPEQVYRAHRWGPWQRDEARRWTSRSCRDCEAVTLYPTTPPDGPCPRKPASQTGR